MTTELIPAQALAVSTQFAANESAYDDIAKGGDFLSRLQLFSKGKAVNKNLVAPGHYGIPVSEHEVIDLGDSIDLVPFARRPKAIDFNDREAILTVYDPKDPEFQRIAAQSAEQDSGCMYGPIVLVFERQSERFLEYFCGSKSTRNEAKYVYPFLPLTQSDIDARGLTDGEPHGPQPLTLKVRLVDGKYSYHVPVVQKCSTPFSRLPDIPRIVKEIRRFISPPQDEVERVDETAANERVR